MTFASFFKSEIGKIIAYDDEEESFFMLESAIVYLFLPDFLLEETCKSHSFLTVKGFWGFGCLGDGFSCLQEFKNPNFSLSLLIDFCRLEKSESLTRREC